MDKINLSASGLFLDVAEMPAGQIVDDADFRATCEQVIRQRRADEGGASRHQHKFSAPKSLRRCHARTAPSIIFTNFCSSLTLSYSGAIARAARPMFCSFLASATSN